MDLLCLTAPRSIGAIHRAYLQAGADIVTTNSFSANAISLKEYGLEKYARRIAREAARIAPLVHGRCGHVHGIDKARGQLPGMRLLPVC